MRIGMVLDTTKGFPPDIRIEKEATALLEAGFEVCLLCRKIETNAKNEELFRYGLKVLRKEIALPNLPARIVENTTFIKFKWIKAIEEFVISVKPDVLHAHDIQIVPNVLKVAKKYKLPTVADLHENRPAAKRAIRSELNWFRKVINSLTNNYYLWRWHEKRALQQCQRVIVVVPEAQERLVNNYSLALEKIYVVSNTEDETTFNVTQYDTEIIKRWRNNWSAIYTGGIGPHRGIDTAIKAAPLAGKEIPGFKMVIVGIASQKEEEQLQKIIAKSLAADFVELIKWVPSGKVNSYIAASKVCLVPHNYFEHTNTTIPHKLFQYMIMGKPVIVSNCQPLQRVVEKAQCGLVFTAGNQIDLARAMVQLYKQGESNIKMLSENARKAALGEFSWKHDKKRLVEMYKRLLS